MENQTSNTGSNAQKLSAEIKKTWGKLSDEEIGFQATQPAKFFDAVKTKYSINKNEAEKTVKKLEADCATASGTSSAKGSSNTSGPTAKPANDSSAPLSKAANS